MITKAVTECIEKAIENPKVRIAVEKRDKSSNARIKSIYSKIRKSKNDSNVFKMVVRVGFDFMLKTQDDDKKEDIIVDVLYVKNKKSGSETFDVINVVFIPEI